jgi:hypothetical protein
MMVQLNLGTESLPVSISFQGRNEERDGFKLISSPASAQPSDQPEPL